MRFHELQEFTIKVEEQDAPVKFVPVLRTDTVLKIKEKIHSMTGMPPVNRQNLFFNGRLLRDDETVKSLNLCEGSVIRLEQNIPSNQPVEPFDFEEYCKRGDQAAAKKGKGLVEQPQQRQPQPAESVMTKTIFVQGKGSVPVKLNVELSTTVSAIKEMFLKIEKIDPPAHMLGLFLNNKLLEDTDTVSNLAIPENTVFGIGLKNFGPVSKFQEPLSSQEPGIQPQPRLQQTQPQTTTAQPTTTQPTTTQPAALRAFQSPSQEQPNPSARLGRYGSNSLYPVQQQQIQPQQTAVYPAHRTSSDITNPLEVQNTALFNEVDRLQMEYATALSEIDGLRSRCDSQKTETSKLNAAISKLNERLQLSSINFGNEQIKTEKLNLNLQQLTKEFHALAERYAAAQKIIVANKASPQAAELKAELDLKNAEIKSLKEKLVTAELTIKEINVDRASESLKAAQKIIVANKASPQAAESQSEIALLQQQLMLQKIEFLEALEREKIISLEKNPIKKIIIEIASAKLTKHADRIKILEAELKQLKTEGSEKDKKIADLQKQNAPSVVIQPKGVATDIHEKLKAECEELENKIVLLNKQLEAAIQQVANASREKTEHAECVEKIKLVLESMKTHRFFLAGAFVLQLEAALSPPPRVTVGGPQLFPMPQQPTNIVPAVQPTVRVGFGTKIPQK